TPKGRKVGKQKRPVSPSRQARTSPAMAYPGARSARQECCLHCKPRAVSKREFSSMWSFLSRKKRQAKRIRRISSSCKPKLEALEDRCVPSAPGTLDSNFGSGGIVATSLAKTYNDLAFAVAVQTDGKIVAAGDHSTQNGGGTVYIDVVRYNSN